jgi:hypothetical protein
LTIRREDESELRGWGGLAVEVPDYFLETSRAGFVYRGGRRNNSVREKKLLVKKRSKDMGERKYADKPRSLHLKKRREEGSLSPRNRC